MCGRETDRQTDKRRQKTDRQKETEDRDRQTDREGGGKGCKKAHGISCMSCFFSLANSSFHSFYSSVLFLEVGGMGGGGRVGRIHVVLQAVAYFHPAFLTCKMLAGVNNRGQQLCHFSNIYIPVFVLGGERCMHTVHAVCLVFLTCKMPVDVDNTGQQLCPVSSVYIPMLVLGGEGGGLGRVVGGGGGGERGRI